MVPDCVRLRSFLILHFPLFRRILLAVRNPNPTPETPLPTQDALSPFKAQHWLALTPAERLRRSWALRSRLPDPRAAHDRKVFPKP